MARKMYIYRADYEILGEPRVRFFYARNAKIGREICKELCTEEGNLAQKLALTKIGTMNTLENKEGGPMDPNEETLLVIKDFGRGLKFAERDGDV